MSAVTRAATALTAFALFPMVAAADQPTTIWRLKAEVEEREREVARAQCELARSHARLAQAEGQTDRAVAELRKVVAYHEKELQRALVTSTCQPQLHIESAQLTLAEARADLAQTEGKPAVLVRELQKIVNLKEKYVLRVRDYLRQNAVPPEVLESANDDLVQTRNRLKAAKKKLADSK